MTTHSVRSKAIRWVRYDADGKVLEVEFASSLAYRYFDVPRDVYEWLLKVPSKGKFVNRLVKEKYRYEPIDSSITSDEITSDETDLTSLLQQSLHDRRNEP